MTTHYVAGRCPDCKVPVAQKQGEPAPLCTDCKVLTEGMRAETPPVLGRKFDGDKPRWDLLIEGMPTALEEVVRVLTFGSRKYADHNWRYVEDAQQRYLAASMRHELAIAHGETHDEETGLHHLAHKLCCDLFRLELALRSQPFDPNY